MKTKNIIILIVVVLALVGVGFYFLQTKEDTSGRLNEFAKCLKDKGAMFYGAFWCSHCQNEKRLFGSSQQYLPYVECSTSDSKGQLQICKDQNIVSYPTWKFTDGSIMTGELGLNALAEKTGCILPQ